jgi:outer membrane protein assembly factor BamB
MKSRIAVLAVGFVAGWAWSAAALAADQSLAWPQFRGPGGSGVAEGQKPPVEFGPEKNVKWKVPVPGGFSSPIVAGDLLVLTAFEAEKLYTIAYSRKDGKEVWRAAAPARVIEPYMKGQGSPAASTAATDGKRIVSYFGSCGLVCYDLAGRELWHFDMPLVAMPGDFGTGTSPILTDGIVVVVRDGIRDSRIVAVDLATGSQKWETKRLSTASYCTPTVWDTPEGREIVSAGHARMVGYDLKSGREKWTVTGVPSACCSSPIAAEGGLYFAGFSPGGEDDPQGQMPTFESLVKSLDADKDGALGKAEAEQAFQGFFDSQDMNKDGKVTRDEWDMVIKFMKEGSSVAFSLKAGGSGDITDTHMLWKQTKGLPYIPTAIAYKGQLVMVKDGGIVTAYDLKTGDEVYMDRLTAAGQYYASPVAANGYVYLISMEDGTSTVLKGGTTQAEVVAKNPPLGERVGATPAIADDTIYVRTETQLYAFSEESSP